VFDTRKLCHKIFCAEASPLQLFLLKKNDQKDEKKDRRDHFFAADSQLL